MSIWSRQTTNVETDYKTAIWAFYRYYPSKAAAVIFTVLFAIATFLHLYQLIRRRTWFFIPFVIGGFCYIGRILSSEESPNWSLGPYIQQTLLLLLVPALSAASIYMMPGRIPLLLDAEPLSLLKRKWLTKFFVTGDILSFTVQAAGGALAAVHNGEKIVIAGLVVQILFFERSQSLDGWQHHLRVLYAANGLIMMRSVLRLIEYAMGKNGYLLRHEAFLYVFDALLMLVVMVLFNIVHPSSLLSGDGEKTD
ncbi:RTA1 domain-containing protein [Aspergillus homomorphus CBS 101889]|uniref:RTA1-domain-containing protein n=1 Tax=Aspergillus homomorphus (strain CBS 101889) TaxID=1450537 RepID=A0A395HNT9_ASPHC|nr:RTA1-domain-containing protein [Aspergillus homomorphus CBS 101889]RAL09276.1 RTA1-domain-containing protein [Aspergillus homomorphus CBS 101889]